MRKQFYNLEWHDAVVTDFLIHRDDDGRCEVILNMDWPESPPSRLVFKHVYRCRLKTGVWGITSCAIITANIVTVNDSTWEWADIDEGDIVCFSIDYGDSPYANGIKIVAKDFCEER